MREKNTLLSLHDTNILKGLAILLLLWHHLFFKNSGLYNDLCIFKSLYLVNQTGIFSKVCVSIFVFLSGYGLTVKAEKNGIIKLKEFYYHRFKKLLFNYWLIWIIFVPISIFVFERTFSSVYGNNIIPQLITDLLGVHKWFFKSHCYNATWWFYSCIIGLYFLFPFIYKLLKIDPITPFIAAIVVTYFLTSIFSPIKYYIISFIIGMCFVIYKVSGTRHKMITISFLLLLIAIRNFSKEPLLLDCFITANIIFLYKSIHINNYVQKLFSFLGKHSMNIFLFHTFIFSYWFKSFIYSPQNPFLIFLLLLGICLLISIILELIKKYTNPLLSRVFFPKK